MPEEVKSTLPSDEPWCGEFEEHNCLGAHCRGIRPSDTSGSPVDADT